jgi:hypothetical protein
VKRQQRLGDALRRASRAVGFDGLVVDLTADLLRE